jgi:Protein of unknown function (DUF3631)
VAIRPSGLAEIFRCGFASDVNLDNPSKLLLVVEAETDPRGIHSRSIRIDDGTTPKGYRREQFADAWARYLPIQNATAPKPARLSGKRLEIETTQTADVALRKQAANSHKHRDVADVALRKADIRIDGEWRTHLMRCMERDAPAVRSGVITADEMERLAMVDFADGLTRAD